jgi:hypothetical protein
LLAAADVGFGSLAMHRIGAEENPALKVREYLARGLAVIIGCHDPDFGEADDQVLRLPNTEDNIADHLDEIDRFVARWQGKRVPRDLVAHLDLDAREATRLRFLAEAASGGRA